MIPMVLARHIQSGLADYVETTFPMTNKPFRGSIRKLAHQEGMLSQEPFVSVKLPFRVVGKHTEFPFPCLHPTYRPYAHQMRAFERISAGESTLVATGTGSGKTECFLYPILDYCYRQRRLGRKGIKAILVYPMNALATDQAKRLAELIHDSPELRNNVTAGMYVGQMSQGGSDKDNHAMTATNIVTSHDELLKNPPDILLTNYKMLDYLLVRPKDSRIWDSNDSNTLKYFVVDELHTFDGAQGTDLACLLRRLTDRLNTTSDDMCFVGTSATMGTEETVREVCAYANQIFNTTFTPESVVTEDRLRVDEFFATSDYDDTMPTAAQADQLIELEEDVDPDKYLAYAAQAWLDDAPTEPVSADKARIRLAESLRHSRFLASLSALICDEPQQIDRKLLDRLAIMDARFNALHPRQQKACVDALIALVSHARTGSEGHTRPFLNVQVQLWVKELGRVVANITSQEGSIDYRPVVELSKDDLKTRMPVINCRDCGGTAWIGLAGKDGGISMGDPRTFYNEYFAYHADNALVTLQPCTMDYVLDPHADNGAMVWFCNACMKEQAVERFESTEHECPACGEQRIPMVARGMELVSGNRKHYRCPFCGSEQDIAMVGVRTTTQVSVMLTQLSGDSFNDDSKAIVFSDSVQDASYRASVFNSRTWRFALRNSAMDYMREEHKDGVSLAEYLNSQNDYYHRRYPDDNEYIVRFIAPNMTWMREYEAVLQGNPAGPGRRQLLDWIERRLRLESLLEFGMRSRTGRTLEKSGCAAIAFDQILLKRVAQTVAERCHNEIGLHENSIMETDWLRLIMAFLDQLRTKGAFFDVTYDQFLQNDGNKFLLSNTNIKWMPGMYADGMPYFLSDKEPVRKGVFNTLNSPAYRQIVDRYLTDGTLEGDIHHELLGIVLEECIAAGFITQQRYPSMKMERTVYGLNESGCMVSGNVTQLICGTCGRSYSCATQNLDAWNGARCRIRKCPGRLVAGTPEAEALELRYYGKLYRGEPSERIHAAEHTGLLNGDDRAKVEEEFKRKDRKPGDVNVLACTPTLEMGIDIGDLSTVILSSIPPTQAQYIQRAGRAGRRDGNSLILAVANTKEHDTYFYQRPEDMLGGAVNPPHIFLDATAVLERQLTAYALDRWVHAMLDAGNNPADVVPDKLKNCLDNVNGSGSSGFPVNFLNWTGQHSGELLDGFGRMFSFSEELRTQLDGFVRGTEDGSTMARRVYDVFQKTNDTVRTLESQKSAARQLLDELKKKPSDSSFEEQQRECEDEIHNLGRIVTSILNTNTFNYLSDEGILPNYAFPETGVTLHTILKEDKEPSDAAHGIEPAAQDKTKRSGKATRDFVRPAATAITELAPGNTFFAGGRKYKISRVLCSKGGADDELAMWRLCPNCSHAEPASSTENLASCPSCGSMQWADNGQKRPMLRIDTVISDETYSESLIEDASDSRPKTQFLKDTMVDINPADIQTGWQFKGTTNFGFDYTPQGTIREINFGQVSDKGASVEISGSKEIRNGFNVCLKCGALLGEHGSRHAYFCPERKKAQEQQLEQTERNGTCLFMYREVKSEVLRMLVPGLADVQGADGAAESLTAAVMLGLRERFGNVEHLQATLMNEPLPDNSGLRKTYLALYDTVPGGTGYLKQLSDPDTMFEVLAKAKEVMEHCECAKNGGDGCYRCLYAYRQSQNLKLISRKTALAMLTGILDPSNKRSRVTTVSKINTNKLFDSGLEQQFIEALRCMHAHPFAESDDAKGRRAIVKDEFINSKPGYSITVNGSVWNVEPQVALGPADGVAIPCKPDFVLTVSNIDESGDVVEHDGRKPVAIFTDGLQYHAGIVAQDSLKREALRQAGYRIWSLDYDDVIGYVQGKDAAQLADPMLAPKSMPSPVAYKSTIGKRTDEFNPSEVSAMAMLEYYLAEPDTERIFAIQALAMSYALNPRNKNVEPQAVDMLHRNEALHGENESTFMICSSWNPSNCTRLKFQSGLCIGEDMRTTEPHVGMVFSDIQRDAAKAKNDDYNPLDALDENEAEAFKTQWAAFWHFANVMQFSEYFHAIGDAALRDESMYEPLRNGLRNAPDLQKDNDSEWNDILADPTYVYCADETKEAVKRFIESDIPAPDVLGYELLDENEEIIAQAELAWEDGKIVFFPSYDLQSDRENVDEFVKRGWTIITENNDDLDKVFAPLTEGEER